MAVIINGTTGIQSPTDTVNTDTDWIIPPLQNGWVTYAGGYGNPMYRRLGNIVHIQGLVKDGTISTSLPVFTLPIGFRPNQKLIFTTESNNVSVRYDISADGLVLPYGGSSNWFSICCAFIVEV